MDKNLVLHAFDPLHPKAASTRSQNDGSRFVDFMEALDLLVLLLKPLRFPFFGAPFVVTLTGGGDIFFVSGNAISCILPLNATLSAKSSCSKSLEYDILLRFNGYF